MRPTPQHHCQIFASPWEGVYSTHIDSAHYYGKHSHATYGLGMLIEGGQKSASGRGYCNAHAGDLITTNPGEVHDGQPHGGASRRWRMVYLEPAVMASLLPEGMHTACVSGTMEVVRPVIQDATLSQALGVLLQRLQTWATHTRHDSSLALACEEALVSAASLLVEHHSTIAPGLQANTGMQSVRDRLADESDCPPTLAELASMLGISKYQLLRRFQKVYGVPPHAWLLQHRAERARGLIQRGTSLAEASAACGFADQSHMTRLFARHFGFTPGAWRSALRAH